MSDLDIPRMRKGVARLGGAGFRVLRVHFNDKRPFDQGWPDLATDHPKALDAWFHETGALYNVGVACGPQPNGINLIVIDVDVNHGGLDRWAALLDINGHPDTAMHS
ncbi:MAG: bifunctional DNA primase/polymerase, partial [Ilumatobacteraceae bacterium]